MPRRVLAPLLLLPLAGCDFSCSLFDQTVAKDKLETELAAWLKSNDLEATDITCPEGQKMEKGNKFECTCEVAGVVVEVIVEVTDPVDGSVEWKPKYLTIKDDQIESAIPKLPELAGRTLTIDCPTVMVSVPNSDWTCDVVDKAAGDLAMVMKLKFTDGEGTYDWTLEPKA